MKLSELIERFQKVATASVADAVDKIAGKRGYMDQEIKPRVNHKKEVGPAVTVLEAATDEFLPPQHVLDLIDEAPAGSVICLSSAGFADVAVWAGMMTAGAVANEHAGAIIVADIDGVIVVPKEHAEAVLLMSEEIDQRELEQAKLIIAERSLRKGLAKYGRI